MKNRIYHGWIVVEDGGPGMKPYFICEKSKDSEMVRVAGPFRDSAQAIEYWDKEVGKKVKLQETPLKAYRVFTD